MTANLVSSLIVLLFAVLPGAAVGARLVRHRDSDLWAWLATAGVVSIALTGVLYLLAHVVDLSLDVAVYAWVALALAATLPFVRDLRSVLRLRTDIAGASIVGFSTIAAFISGPWLGLNVDTFYHLAAVRSLLQRGALIVTDPFYGSTAATSDPSSGLLHAWMAILCRVKGADPLYLVWGMNVLGAVLVVAGMLTLAKAVTRSARGAALVTWAYVLLVIFSDFRSMAYPSRISMGIAFVGLAALLEFMRSRDRSAAVVLAVSSFTVVSHLGTTQGFIAVAAVMVFGYALCDRSSPARHRLMSAVLVLGIVILSATPLALPRVQALTSQTQLVGTSSPEDGMPEGDTLVAVTGAVSVPGGAILDPVVFYESGRITFIASLVLAAAVLGTAIQERDGVMGATAASVLLAGVLALVPPLTWALLEFAPYVLRRLLASMRFAAVLPVASVLAYRGIGRRRDILRVLAACWLVIAVIAAAPFVRTVWWKTPSTSVQRIGQANESIWRTHSTSMTQRMSQVGLDAVRQVIGDSYPVVAASEETGYVLAGLLPVRIVASGAGHSPVSVEVEQGPERREAMERFFEPGTSADERRAIAEKWDIDYAFVWVSTEQDRAIVESIDRQYGLFEPVVDMRGLVLWRVIGAGASD